MLHVPASVWVALVGVLLVNKLGLGICLLAPFLVAVFCLGLFSVLSAVAWHETTAYCHGVRNKPIQFRRAHLTQVLASMTAAEAKPEHPRAGVDRRMTGSREIDVPLQEVLGYIIKDHILEWYQELSDDAEFIENVQRSSQETIVTLVSRMKEVDWMPYLTTRLVDDAASHLRLYRQAKTRLKQDEAAGETLPPLRRSQQLEKHFFDLELEMEKKLLCRDAVCLGGNNRNLEQYLQDVSELLLFLLLPEADFTCQALRLLLRDLLTHSALLPLIEMLSEPDFINQTIINLAELRRIQFSSEMLLNVLRITDSTAELIAVTELLNKDVAKLRSCDLGLEDDRKIKQQLSSLLYAKKIIDTRLQILQEGSEVDSAGLPSHGDWKQLVAPGQMIALPLDVLLKNNIALSYLIDFMMSIGAQAYIYFYLNVEGWRVSAEQQLSDLQLQRQTLPEETPQGLEAAHVQMLDNMKSAARSIFEQYLSEKACPRIKISEILITRLSERIHNNFPCETWFDEIQNEVYNMLKNEERFVPAFRQSYGYMRLLVELELLKEPGRSDDEDTHSIELLEGELEAPVPASPGLEELNLPCAYLAEITDTGLANEHGNKYGFYSISVVRRYSGCDREESWHICRRYSDFLSLHQRIRDRYEDLGRLPFPSKKAFHNTERATLVRRMRDLNSWLQLLLNQLQGGGEASSLYPEAAPWLHLFLQRGEYEQQTPRQFARAVSFKVEQLLVKPLRSSLRTVGNAVRAVPETMSKAIHSRHGRQSGFEASKVGASLDVEADDNIPLRIMLLLLDEVFDLKSRNQWLRRRIVSIVRQIVEGMFGGLVNRRILEYVARMTSPPRVATYIEFFRDTFWPGGLRAVPEAPREESDNMRTRVLAKMALLASMTDEIKRIMGTETTRRGLLLVFEMFQQPRLNRRLALVLFEGILQTLFPEHNFTDNLQKLHSLSMRTCKGK